MSAAVHMRFRAQAGDLELDVGLDGLTGTTLIVGPNGAGKSSLLKVLLGVLDPSEGVLRVGDDVLFDRSAGVDVPIEDRCIGYVPQSYSLFPHMTARQNVEFGVGAAGAARVNELLDRLGVAHLADRKAKVLSGGESQRVAIARALAPDPRLLLLDEPMAALDPTARVEVRSFLAEILGVLSVPAIVVSHELDDVLSLGDKVAVLEAGRVVQAGTVHQVIAAPATDFTRAFFRAGTSG
ncbi:MAG: ATP-binding cassette domain-containing protein [Myxococcota bacterium]